MSKKKIANYLKNLKLGNIFFAKISVNFQNFNKKCLATLKSSKI